MKTINYEKAKLYPSTLDFLYSLDSSAIDVLDKNLLSIVTAEAPITKNILKARLREAYGVGKISQKALDIIDSRINALNFTLEESIYDTVIWPSKGIFNVDYLREGCPREIYDIPYQEMKNLTNELNYSGEELYRKILEYFGYQVLTHKALEYLKFIELKCK